jgi:hypothetical protein
VPLHEQSQTVVGPAGAAFTGTFAALAANMKAAIIVTLVLARLTMVAPVCLLLTFKIIGKR